MPSPVFFRSGTDTTSMTGSVKPYPTLERINVSNTTTAVVSEVPVDLEGAARVFQVREV